MDLFEKLSFNEVQMIDWYINAYSGERTEARASLSKILRVWNQNKQTLYKAFGNRFTVSKNICIKTPIDALRKEMESLIFCNSKFNRWRSEILNKLYDIDYEIYNTFNDAIIAAKPLAKNIYEGENFEIKIGENLIRVQDGMKVMKIISKLAKAFDVEETFEEFRLEHSRILNTATLKGELVLSIHPLDYMTMSDNACDWSSCMSWNDEGCYRRGTVEMMNGEDVVVAYLKSSSPMSIGNNEWEGNKKWRSLILFDKNYITSVKGYPYLSRDLSQIAIQMLVDLAKENLGWNYDDTIYKYSHDSDICTPRGTYRFRFAAYDAMYNDFGSCKHHICIGEGLGPERHFFQYGGPSTCMCCGQTGMDYAGEGDLICDDCNDVCYCYECGERIDRYYAYYDEDGNPYCEFCFNESFRTDVWNKPDEPVHVDNTYTLYLLSDNIDKDKITNTYCLAGITTATYGDQYALRNYLVDPSDRHFSKYFEVIHCGGWRESVNYITPEQLTNDGLRYLFGLNRDSVEEYLTLAHDTEALTNHVNEHNGVFWDVCYD